MGSANNQRIGRLHKNHARNNGRKFSDTFQSSKNVHKREEEGHREDVRHRLHRAISMGNGSSILQHTSLAFTRLFVLKSFPSIKPYGNQELHRACEAPSLSLLFALYRLYLVKTNCPTLT